MSYTCGICGKKIEHDLMVFTDHTRQHIFDEIAKQFPHWKDSNGACRRCVDYFESQIKGKK